MLEADHATVEKKGVLGIENIAVIDDEKMNSLFLIIL